MKSLVERIRRIADRFVGWFPGRLQPYVLPVLALAVLAVLALPVVWAGGPKAVATVIVLMMLAVMVRAAWAGYGPGLLIAFLILVPLPKLYSPKKPLNIDPMRTGLLAAVLVLISRTSATKRRTEESLRRAAEGLEQRVVERTLELQQSEERLREQAELLNLADDAILTRDEKSVIRFWNPGAARMYGWTAEEAVGKVSHMLLAPQLPEPLKDIEAKLLATGSWQGELRHTTRNGKQLTVMSRWALRRNRDGEPCGTLEINTDITHRRSVEEQLRHAQKLESVGLLAGGVAHDFNNLLTVINGYSEMLLGEVGEESSVREPLVEIRAAGDRAAGLTQQLLAFSRKQVVRPTVLNLNLVVQDAHKMLRRLIGENIEMNLRLASDLSNVVADSGQIQQIILNLAVNARDAMPRGGTLLVETTDVEFDESYVSVHPEVRPGAYVMLAVTDTGIGITPEIQERLFEPFFTTKAPGAGTGLGLATVYGMVKQNGGWIWVYSEPGQGATFKVYLPRTGAPLAQVQAIPRSDLRGKETILVVEDQVEVRGLAVTGLRRYGYKVLSAANAAEALEMVERSHGIDLVLTDVVMPGMSGCELGEVLRRTHPELHVVYMSGYTEGAIAGQGVLDPEAFYIQKPFTPELLAEKVREILGPKGVTGTVLVVDDDESVRRYVRGVLTGARLAVVEASDGKQALEQVARSRFDLVITDLVMPEQEGIETIQRLHREHPEVKVIAMSGAFGDSVLFSATKLGAHAALSKPIGKDELLRTVKHVLQLDARTIAS